MMIKQLRNVLMLMATTLCLGACDMLDVHPYDGKVDGETGINERNMQRIEEALKGRDTFRFAVISDTQRWNDETEDEVASINARGDIDFVVHCGDVTDFAITKEFEWQRDLFARFQMPYVLLIGNHDCLGSGRSVWRAMWGDENFSFVAGNTRFVCLDTNALEFDFDRPVPDLNFIKQYWADSTVTNTVVALHAGPYNEQFNNNLAEAFEYYLLRLTNPMFCIFGHGHVTEQTEPFDDGLMYYQITCAKDRQYYVFTVNKDEYTYEIVDY